MLGYVGYNRSCPGTVLLTEPPNESDIIVFNLTDPACFDRRRWDSDNDNYHCTVVDKTNKSMYITDSRYDGSTKYPVFKLIESGHIKKGFTTFHYTHLQKTISKKESHRGQGDPSDTFDTKERSRPCPSPIHSLSTNIY